MNESLKTTVPDSTVGAVGEQPLFIDNSIIDKTERSFNSGNDTDEGCRAVPVGTEEEAIGTADAVRSIAFSGEIQDEIMQVVRRYSGGSSLDTCTETGLYGEIYRRNPPIIEGILYPGTYILAGAPKLGKSFLVMQIAHHIAAGKDLWGYRVRAGVVLYLALEDDKRRLQERSYRMFDGECTENLHFATKAEDLSGRLMEQISRFVEEHPKTVLIIIDTLQKVRPVSDDKYSYANDYHIIETMKQFTDESGLCILLIHHTRKQKADDPFEMISGTNGLLGAADGAFLMRKNRRVSNEAEIEICGRDQPEQKLILKRNEATLAWDLDKAEVELYHPQPDPLLEAVGEFITKDHPEWTGPASDLAIELGVEFPPQTLSMKLNVLSSRLLEEYQIRYQRTRSRDSRHISLRRIGKSDA